LRGKFNIGTVGNLRMFG